MTQSVGSSAAIDWIAATNAEHRELIGRAQQALRALEGSAAGPSWAVGVERLEVALRPLALLKRARSAWLGRRAA